MEEKTEADRNSKFLRCQWEMQITKMSSGKESSNEGDGKLASSRSHRISTETVWDNLVLQRSKKSCNAPSQDQSMK